MDDNRLAKIKRKWETKHFQTSWTAFQNVMRKLDINITSTLNKMQDLVLQEDEEERKEEKAIKRDAVSCYSILIMKRKRNPC